MIGIFFNDAIASLRAAVKKLQNAQSSDTLSAPKYVTSPATLALADHNKSVFVEATLTVPSGLPEGFRCWLYNRTGSAKTIAGSGIDINMYQIASASATGIASCTLQSYGWAELVITADGADIFGSLSES